MAETRRKYEIIAILDPSESEAGKKLLGEIVSKNGGQAGEQADWGEKRMFHDAEGQLPIARYVYQPFEGDPQSVKTIAREMQLSAPIVRHMVKRVD